MAYVEKKFNDGPDQLQEKLAKFDQEVSRMDSRIQTLSDENEVLNSRIDSRIQTLSDENEVLRNELKQVQEKLVRSVEGEEGIYQDKIVRFVEREEDNFQDQFVPEIFENNEENPVANRNDNTRSILKQTSILAFFQRQTNVIDDDSIYNTGTVHMHAIAVTSACVSKPNPKKSWCFACGSMLLVCCQIAVLRWLIFESSYGTCAIHTDCNAGEFCQQNDRKWHRSRCNDCEFSLTFWDDENDKKSEVDKDFCSGFMEKEYSSDELDQSVARYTPDKVYHNDNFNITDQKHRACYAYAFCEKEDFQKGICVHLNLRRSRLSIDQILIFIMVSLLFTSTLCADIEEAAIEEKILTSIRELVGDRQSIPRSTYLLVYSLRLRRYMLPWLYASATVSIMIKEEFSASNILLNLLTIGFVTEADSLLATLLFSKREVKIVDEFVAMVKARGVQSVSFFWTRVLGLFASTLIVVVTFQVESLEPIFGSDKGVCSDIHNTIGLIFFLYVPLCYIFIHGFGKPLLSNDKYVHKIDKVLYAVMDISTDLAVFCMSNFVIIFSSFAVYTSNGMWEQKSLELSANWGAVTLIGTFCFIFVSIYISRCIDRQKAR